MQYHFVYRNEYYKYFLKNHESFVIRTRKNRNVIYNGKTQNIIDLANKYKSNYPMDFMDKHGKKIECKVSYILVGLCEFQTRASFLGSSVWLWSIADVIVNKYTNRRKKAVFNSSKNLLNAMENSGIFQV